jgi:hypothetical protein
MNSAFVFAAQNRSKTERALISYRGSQPIKAAENNDILLLCGA